jgi:hypothetical protein
MSVESKTKSNRAYAKSINYADSSQIFIGDWNLRLLLQILIEPYENYFCPFVGYIQCDT